MKYLRKFATEADVNMSAVPNVVLVGDTGRVIYNVLNGVFIQHIDGSLYTTDEWTAGGFANDQANGVAVGEGTVKFVIAKEDVSTSKKSWSSNTSNLLEGVITTSEANIAKTDYAGAENTAIIAATDTSGAAYSCSNYTFPNGSKGYVPALGEFVIAYKYKSAIATAMSLVGGTNISDSSYWSSTQSGASYAWYFPWASGSQYVGKDVKSYKSLVRPFTTL